MPRGEHEHWLGLAVSTGAMTLTALSSDAIRAGSPDLGVRTEAPLTSGTPAESVTRIVEQVERHVLALQHAGLPHQVGGLGLSIGGHVDRSAGRVVFAHDLVVDDQHWKDEPLAHNLSSRLGFPVVLDNDVNCMAHYHHRVGVASGRDHVAFLYISPGAGGFGAAFVCNGTVYGGARGGAGEIGHLVVQPEGPRCRCGNRGCLQALVSGANLMRNVNWGGAGGHQVTTISEAGRLADAEDARALRAFTSAGRFFGQGLAAVTNLLNPELLVMGGAPEYVDGEQSGRRSSQAFTAAVREMLATSTYSDLAVECEIVFAQMDLATAAAGAAHLAHAAQQGTAPAV